MLKRGTQVLGQVGTIALQASAGIAMALVAASSAQAIVPAYQIDDGVPEGLFGFRQNDCSLAAGTPLVDLLWLNKFDVSNDIRFIDTISLRWGAPVKPGGNSCGDYKLSTAGLDAGQAAQVLLYDTDAQGNLRLVRSLDIQVQNPGGLGGNGFVDIAIPRTRVTGNQFYVGALLPNQAQGQFPAAYDTSSNAGRSYYVANPLSTLGSPVPPANRDYSNIQLNPTYNNGDTDPSTGRIAGRVMGNWLLRAHGSPKPIPEPATAIGLLAIGVGIALKRRSR